MKVLSKSQYLVTGGLFLTYCFFCFPVFSVSKTIKRSRYYFLGLMFLSKKNRFNDKNKFERILDRLSGQRKVVSEVWFDHTLGGGTDVYARRQIEEIRKLNLVVRIQCIPKLNQYIISLIDSNSIEFYSASSLEEMEVVLSLMDFQKLVVNNLVGHANVLGILLMIKSLVGKKKFSVRFNLHDFYSVCPNFNLLYKGQRFCRLDFSGCEECFSFVSNEKCNLKLPIFVNGAVSWRDSWLIFFEEVCDQIFVFSDSSKEIFLKTYPSLESKIKVFPHSVPSLRSVKIEKHEGLNIAFLGAITSEAKGYTVVKNLILSNLSDRIKFFVVGEFPESLKGLKILGRYKLERLPGLIEEEKIDLIIIPSICPETFSYTTSEAIQLGIPVACFDLGAQAEKVKLYKKGIIFSEMEPRSILRKLKDEFCL